MEYDTYKFIHFLISNLKFPPNLNPKPTTNLNFYFQYMHPAKTCSNDNRKENTLTLQEKFTYISIPKLKIPSKICIGRTNFAYHFLFLLVAKFGKCNYNERHQSHNCIQSKCQIEFFKGIIAETSPEVTNPLQIQSK